MCPCLFLSPSMLMMLAWWMTRSMRAMAHAAVGKRVVHSETGRLVVRTIGFFSGLRDTTRKRRSAFLAS
ncbi:hypothetical protein BHS06_08285 [Myxococcus xanthus]|nr:hypothetical protein BHS06_08285 [Myxococcus xanthus]